MQGKWLMSNFPRLEASAQAVRPFVHFILVTTRGTLPRRGHWRGDPGGPTLTCSNPSFPNAVLPMSQFPEAIGRGSGLKTHDLVRSPLDKRTGGVCMALRVGPLLDSSITKLGRRFGHAKR
jgi:hypothetical protein